MEMGQNPAPEKCDCLQLQNAIESVWSIRRLCIWPRSGND